MARRLVLGCVLVAAVLVAARPADAQERQERIAVGGGLGYTFDMDSETFLQVQGVGWIPIKAFPKFYFTPFALLPRFQYFQGIERWQLDLGGIWDIPVADTMSVRPYMGIGVGISHMTDETVPVFNYEAGFRIKKPTWSHQFKAGFTYSAGLDFGNVAVLHFSVLFGVGGS